MLEQSFWQFFGACVVAGCLWLIISIAIGNFVGGDLCVCHHHGEVPCNGCEDCNWGNPDDEFYKEEADG